MDFHIFADSEHIRRERQKAQELRKSNWWKQQVGRGVCYYCGEKIAKELLTMDHVIPVARGGKSSKNNCVVCCKDCNNKKGHLTPFEITLEELNPSNDSQKDGVN